MRFLLESLVLSSFLVLLRYSFWIIIIIIIIIIIAKATQNLSLFLLSAHKYYLT